MKRIVLILMMAALVAVALMGSPGSAFGRPKITDIFIGCAGTNNAADKVETPALNKASPVLFSNCGDILPPGQDPTPPPTP